MNKEELYCVALSITPKLSKTMAKKLLDIAGDATTLYENPKKVLDSCPQIKRDLLERLLNKDVLNRAEKEILFADKHNIKCISYSNLAYPGRLKNCDDAPVALFFKGDVDFNSRKVVSIVGTRMITPYGKEFCENFITDLADICPDILIISGLAYGVDITAHKNAVKHNLATVGVLAHGLDRLYPSVHRDIAKDMLKNGGLLTEFTSGTIPDKYNFISRNRIVAGISDATIVVESKIKGGALITAELANDYNRECFAVPGNIFAECSKGCNQLIKDNKACLIQGAEDFCQAMSWNNRQLSDVPVQRELFVELTCDEQTIVNLLSRKGELNIDMIAVETGIPIFQVNVLLFELEMKNVIKAMAGGIYKLL